MLFLSGHDTSLYRKIVEEDDFFYEGDDKVVIEKFYKICVEE
jgi:hypothetical protein